MLSKNLIEGTRHKVWQVMYQNRAMRTLSLRSLSTIRMQNN